VVSLGNYWLVERAISNCDELKSSALLFNLPAKRADAIRRRAQSLLKELLALKATWDMELGEKQSKSE
jgi:hypothetical protein